jgi:hypothetical protein
VPNRAARKESLDFALDLPGIGALSLPATQTVLAERFASRRPMREDESEKARRNVAQCRKPFRPVFWLWTLPVRLPDSVFESVARHKHKNVHYSGASASDFHRLPIATTCIRANPGGQ